MSDRWIIYKDGQALGPFAPEEIRQSLREGTFDPFDLVSREGSSVRRELVEVDELFFTSKVVYAGDQASSASNPASSAAPAAFAPTGNLPALVGESTQASQRGAPDVAGNGQLVLASANRATVASESPRPAAQQKSSRRRRRDPKHFHVMDLRGRVLGPVSASEIQALFYKGVLDKDVKVMRDGSRAQVPVARFVAIYSESNRARRAMQQGAHPAVPGGISRAGALPMPRVAMGTPASAVSPFVVIALVAALLFGGMAAYFFLKGGGANWSAKERPAATKQTKAKLKKKKKKPLPAQVRRTGSSAAEKIRADRLVELKRQRAKLLELKQRREARAKQKAKAKLARDEAAARARMIQAKKPAPKLVSAPKPAPKPLPLQSPTQPLPKALPKAPPPATPPKPQGQTVASLADGQQVQKLGPMTFDKNALAECDGSCSLTFTGAGGSVKGAFFKQVWGPALEGKSGGVYLSGLVKKNGDSVRILVSNVQ